MTDDRLERIAEVMRDYRLAPRDYRLIPGAPMRVSDGDEAVARRVLEIADGGERVEGWAMRETEVCEHEGVPMYRVYTEEPGNHDGPATLILRPRDTEGTS